MNEGPKDLAGDDLRESIRDTPHGGGKPTFRPHPGGHLIVGVNAAGSRPPQHRQSRPMVASGTPFAATTHQRPATWPADRFAGQVAPLYR